MTIDRRRVVLAAGLAGCAAAAGAQTRPAAQRYAVLSLIGDEISLVSRRVATGSSAQPIDRTPVPIDDPSLDAAAFVAADAAIAAVDPDADRLRFSIRDKRLFAQQERLGDPAGDAVAAGLRDAVLALARDAKATRLVIVTKRRAEANFRLVSETTGIGKLTGVGFYADNRMQLREVDSGESSSGYIASFATIAVFVVDVASGAVLSTEPGEAHRITTTASLGERGKTSTYAWEAMTPRQKASSLDAVIRQATAEAVESALRRLATPPSR